MAGRFIRSLSGAVRRRLGHRRRFARLRDWGITLYDALLRYGKRLPLPLRHRVWGVRLRQVPEPVFLRLGSSDGFVLEEIFIAEVYRCVIDAELGDVRQIVDLGANAGLSVRLWRQRYPEARIIAVEPDPGNFAICQRNAGEDEGISLVQACAAGRAGMVYLDRSAEECAIRMTADGGGSDPVPAMTVPEILAQGGAAESIDIFKCDIEGAEEELFADCESWIGRVRNIMIELHPPYGRRELLRDLEQAGADFEVAWSGETAGNDLLLLRRPASPGSDVDVGSRVRAG